MVRACVCLQKYQSLVVVVVVGALRKVAPTPKEYQAIRVVRKENILTHTRFLPDVHTQVCRQVALLGESGVAVLADKCVSPVCTSRCLVRLLLTLAR
jgi:hypothetical protein